MKYAIFHVIEGNEKVFLQELKDDIEEKFKLKKNDFKSFPHLTIKYDFETEDIKLIENLLSKICEKHTSFRLSFSGVSSFGKKVVFLKTQENEHLRDLYKNLCRELKEIDWITWEKYELENYFPHFTVVYKQLNDNNSTPILNYLKQKDIKIEINFNNLAITKIENKERKIHKLLRLA